MVLEFFYDNLPVIEILFGVAVAIYFMFRIGKWVRKGGGE